jgi:DNA polymerase V
MKMLSDFVSPKEQEIYSIDECFLDLTAHSGNYDLTEYAHQIRQRVFSWLGLPVCIGIGRSKTEAKLRTILPRRTLTSMVFATWFQWIHALLKLCIKP